MSERELLAVLTAILSTRPVSLLRGRDAYDQVAYFPDYLSLHKAQRDAKHLMRLILDAGPD